MTATRETFAGMGGVEKAIWYFASFLSTGLFLYGIYRLVRRWRAGRGALPRPRIGDDAADRADARVDPAPRRVRRLRARRRLLRLPGPVRRHGDPRVPGRLRRAGARLDVLGGRLLQGLLAVPRPVRPGAGDRRRLLHRAPVHDAAVEAHVRRRRLGVHRPAVLPGAERLRAGGAAHRHRPARLRGVGAGGLRGRQRPARRRARAGDGRDAAARHVVGARHRGPRRSWRRSRAPRRCT